MRQLVNRRSALPVESSRPQRSRRRRFQPNDASRFRRGDQGEEAHGHTAVGGSEAGGPPKLFVRRSLGLVREMSAGDALIGNILIFNLVIASITLLLIPWTFPGASLPLSIVLTFIPAAFLATVYVLFGVAMPRSGGDYVFISRTLHPAVGFAANFSFVIWNATTSGSTATGSRPSACRTCSPPSASPAPHTAGPVRRRQSAATDLRSRSGPSPMSAWRWLSSAASGSRCGR